MSLLDREKMFNRERIALFVDGSNAYATAKAMNIDIDYSKLRNKIALQGNLVRAYYYTALIEGRRADSIQPLVDWLSYNYWEVRTKKAKVFINNDGREKVKGNMDIDMVMDMVKLTDSGRIDVMYLFTGDGDFVPVLDYVQNKGVRVVVISSLVVRPPMIADELRRKCDQFIDLQEWVSDVSHRA